LGQSLPSCSPWRSAAGRSPAIGSTGAGVLDVDGLFVVDDALDVDGLFLSFSAIVGPLCDGLGCAEAGDFCVDLRHAIGQATSEVAAPFLTQRGN
jgi:hypothetical protein